MGKAQEYFVAAGRELAFLAVAAVFVAALAVLMDGLSCAPR